MSVMFFFLRSQAMKPFFLGGGGGVKRDACIDYLILIKLKLKMRHSRKPTKLKHTFYHINIWKLSLFFSQVLTPVHVLHHTP